MKTLHVKEFNTATHKGFKKAVEFEKNNPDWKRLTPRIELVWYYELEEIDGRAYSNKQGKWLNIKEFGL